jgi:hypothetical protein
MPPGQLTEHTDTALRVAQTAMYGGGGTAVIFGLSPGQWQALGVMVGIVVGVGGLALTWYYKRKTYLLELRKAGLTE